MAYGFRGRRRPTNTSALPATPGRYFWSEWKAEFDVYKRRGKLYLSRNGIEILISPFIAGTFTKVGEKE